MGKEASRSAPASFLIHFSARFSGWAEADFRSGSPAASRGLLLACGIDFVARYLAFSVIPAKAGIQCRSSRLREPCPHRVAALRRIGAGVHALAHKLVCSGRMPMYRDTEHSHRQLGARNPPHAHSWRWTDGATHCLLAFFPLHGTSAFGTL